MNVDPRTGAGPLISNLMRDGCVEVACMIDRNGINPVRFGQLPPHLAAAIHALLLDPLCAACCSPAEIRQMTLELFDAQQEFLPGYR